MNIIWKKPDGSVSFSAVAEGDPLAIAAQLQAVGLVPPDWEVVAINAPIPESPLDTLTWGAGALVVDPSKAAQEALQQAKTVRQAEVNALQVTISSGKTFDGNEAAQERMNRANTVLHRLNGLLAAGAPVVLPAEAATIYQVVAGEYQILWVLADNSPAFVTVHELEEALTLAGASQSAIWVRPYQ